MIIFEKEDLRSQEGMDRAFQHYFTWMREECDGTFNAMMDAKFVSCDYEKKTVLVALDTKPWMTNPSNMVHGGITASALDFTMGLLARFSTTGYMTPTVSMEVSYLRPMPLGERVLMEAEITMAGFSLCHATAKAWAESAPEKLIATAAGSYFVTRRPD